MHYRFILFCGLINFLLVGVSHKVGIFPSSNFTATKLQITEADFVQRPKEKGEQWLKEIFSCSDKDGYCLPDEDKVLSNRFQRFIQASNALFMQAYNRSEKEQKEAEAAYQTKWESTYPLYKEETWPFGRGNGGIKTLEDVDIRPIGGLNYLITIDFLPNYRSVNKVSLIQDKGHFLIDYIDTEIIDFQVDENQNRDMEFTQSWTWAYKDESIDKKEIGHKGKITAYYNPKTKNWLMNRDTYGFLGEMFKWVIGRSDGTYLYSTISPHLGEGNDIGIQKVNRSSNNTEIPKYLELTNNLNIFKIEGWPTGFLIGEEYKFTGTSMAESNIKHLKRLSGMSFTPLYYLGSSFAGEPRLPYNFSEDLPSDYLLVKDRTIYTGHTGKAYLQLKRVRDTTITVKIEKL